MPPSSAFPCARAAADTDIPALVALWDACGLSRPHNHGPTDIAFARRGPNSDVLVLEEDARVVASVLVGHDGHRGWVYYVAVHPDCRRRGLGTQMMAQAEKWLHAKGIWKMHLMVRTSNAAVRTFYEQLGFADDSVVVLSKRLRPMPHIDDGAILAQDAPDVV
jgi:ribosomal protein S18 acetylase RimI-like enzyme